MHDCPIPAERLESLGFVRSADNEQWERPASADGPALMVQRATAEMQEAAVREWGEGERPHWYVSWPLSPTDTERMYVPLTDEDGLRFACQVTRVERQD